jgi:hypothetical protein
MIETSSSVKLPPLLSPRTASYVAALIQEGDTFDYSTWLREAQAKERLTKQTIAAGTWGELVRRELCIQSTPPERLDVWATSGLIPTIRTAPFPTAIRRSRHRKTGDDTSGARLTRRLERICEAWNDFQSSRARDAVYGYLAHVLAIVEHYKVRRKTSKLLRQAFEFANLRFNKNGDPFTAIIRCTSDDSVDSKTISKWARALRYVARCKKPTTPLKRFVKRNGGINACANLYARYFGRGRQAYTRWGCASGTIWL